MLSLSKRRWECRASNKNNDGVYYPLQNYTTEKLERDVGKLETKASATQLITPINSKKADCPMLLETPTSTIYTQRTGNTPTALEYELLKSEFDKQPPEVETEKKKI